jgi:heme/copper-type cytochrome/quinol oxidase subunit 2
LRRSPTEYALLGLLIVLRLIEDSVKHNRRGIESLVLTALISLAVIEPIFRTTFIVMKYRRNENAEPTAPPESPL